LVAKNWSLNNIFLVVIILVYWIYQSVLCFKTWWRFVTMHYGGQPFGKFM